MSTGTGSLLSVPALVSWSGQGAAIGLTVTGGGDVNDPALNTFTDVSIDTDTTLTLTASVSYTITSGANI